jgi:hypothetical protein
MGSTHPRIVTLVLLAAFAALACDATTGPDGLPIESVVLGEPVGLVQPMQVRLTEAAPLELVYGIPGQTPLRILSPPALSHDIALARLPADTEIHWRINGSGHAGIFRSRPLPADLAAIGFEASGVPTTPLALVHLFDPNGFRGYAVVDPLGEVVWWWRTEGFPYGAARRPNGNFVFLDGARGLLEVTPGGTVVHSLEQTEERTGHHDAIVNSAGNVLFIAFDRRVHNDVPLRGEAIWEWTPESGVVARRWSSWDHLSPELDRGPRFGDEWLHANALATGPRGNTVISLHFINQIVSIAPDWSSLEWRLGGVNPTIAVAPEDRFSGQHTAREIASGRVLLFDNGFERGGPSRALELDITGTTATRRWEWFSDNRNFASAVSSARRLDSGTTLVAFGMSAGQMGATGPTEFYEVTESSAVLWHVLVRGTSVMFRVEPWETIAGERRIGDG